MPAAPAFLSRRLSGRFTRFVVMWLVAVVLPLQGAAVGIFSAMGPAHIHQPAEAPLVLEDVRRWRPAPVASAPACATALAWAGHAGHLGGVGGVGCVGHVHPDAAPQRHHHAADDGSMVRIGANDPLDSADADEALGAGALSALSVLALIPAVPAWADAMASTDAASRPHWALRTGFVDFPDRPPKRA